MKCYKCGNELTTGDGVGGICASCQNQGSFISSTCSWQWRLGNGNSSHDAQNYDVYGGRHNMTCDRCSRTFDVEKEPGAIMFGHPVNANGFPTSWKAHICQTCEAEIVRGWSCNPLLNLDAQYMECLRRAGEL